MGARMPGGAQLQPLLDERDGQRMAKRLQGSCDRHGAMTVSVSLDDAEHPNAGTDGLANP